MDLQPEEPATLAKHSGHVSLRERLLRFNVAVLRVVTAACAGLPHSKQVKAFPSPPPVSWKTDSLPQGSMRLQA